MIFSFRPNQLKNLRKYLQGFSAKTKAKGKAIFEKNQVKDLAAMDKHTASARVGELEVTLEVSEEGWETWCTCPVELECEHGYAVGLAVLEADPANPLEQPLELPEPAEVGLDEKLARSLGRKLTGEERLFVQRLEKLFASWENSEYLSDWDVQQLLPGWKFRTHTALELWPAPPPDVETFWFYIAEAARQRDVAIPEYMGALRPPGDLEEQVRSFERKREVENWMDELRSMNVQVSTGAEPIELRLAISRSLLHWELHVRSRSKDRGEFRLIKGGQIQKLLEDFRAGNVVIASECVPAIQFLAANEELAKTGKLLLDDPAPRRLLHPLFVHEPFARLMVAFDGTPFSKNPKKLFWRVREQESYSLIELVDETGKTYEDLLALPGEPSIYLSKKETFEGPPPWEARTRTAASSSRKSKSSGALCQIPTEALETRSGIAFLKKIGADLPARLQSKVREDSLRVSVQGKVVPIYAGSSDEVVQLKITANALKGDYSETLTPNGWVPTEKRLSEEDLWDFDRKNVLDFMAVWESLAVAWDHDDCWRLRLTKKFAEGFVKWLEALPADVDVQLEGELASFLSAPISGTVRLECEPDGIDWFSLKTIIDVTDMELTQEEIKALLEARGGFVRLEGKGWRRMKFHLSKEEEARLADLGLDARDFSGEPQRLHALQLSGESTSKLLPKQQFEEIRRRAEEIRTRVAPPIPRAIQADLRHYQVDGFHFLAYLTANRFGGILADDMGLGKTLQTLTWLAWVRAEEPDAGPSLVICPKSVMENWQSEANHFFPDLRVRIWRVADGDSLTSAVPDTDVLVINYAQLRTLSGIAMESEWHAVILDEGQYIKNPDSQTARAACQLKARHRLVLSGTPIENRLLDLWSLITFAMPGALGNRANFLKRFDSKTDPLARQRLAARVRPFLLRRTKEQVAPELPERIEEDLICEMEEVQRELYQAELKRAQRMLLNIETSEELNANRMNFLTSLLRLRQLCCHPALVDKRRAQVGSAKVDALLDVLEPLMEEGQKVLVFSQFVGMLEILQEEIKQRGWPQFILTGQTEQRGDLVKDFQTSEGAGIFLISLKAGGFGLNLTAASYVVLFDPWWNPAVENQAIDRTHRIGQSSKVIAYRILIKDSVEQKIRGLQQTKTALATDVLGEEALTNNLSLEDFRFLFE
jgi:hypothetical protein